MEHAISPSVARGPIHAPRVGEGLHGVARAWCRARGGAETAEPTGERATSPDAVAENAGPRRRDVQIGAVAVEAGRRSRALSWRVRERRSPPKAPASRETVGS